jgi:hypothetical protein
MPLPTQHKFLMGELLILPRPSLIILAGFIENDE